MAVSDYTTAVDSEAALRTLAILVTIGGAVVLAVLLTASSIAVAMGAY